MKVIIVGGGASGLMLASILKTNNANVDITILEKLEHVGKKILMSGNGKCNLSNKNITPLCFNNEFGYKIASSFDVEKYFNDLGLLTYSDNEGRIYPISNVANSVLDVLRESIKDVNVNTSFNVTRIIKNENNYFVFNDKGQKLEADIVVLASGGKTYYKENNTYIIASMLSHRITPLRPTLSSLKVSENLASIENLRAKVNAKLIANNNIVYEDKGEVLFKKDALSGIVIFQLSSIIARNPFLKYSIELDLLPSMDENKLEKYLTNHPSMTGLFAKMINQYVIKKANSNNPKDLAYQIKHLRFSVLDNMDFKNAQVTSGGISIKELNENLESKFNSNLYFLGELIDVDAICGGYNLHFAFSSASVVANDIINKVGINNEKQ